MTGREKCKLLREIRRNIAQANHIPYPPDECDYEGEDCSGTCPRCDLEIEYLQMSLLRKRKAGENVIIDRYTDSALRFQSLPAPDHGQDPRELPVFSQASWIPTAEIILALNKEGIITVGDLLRVSPDYLIRHHHIDIRELERMEEMLRKLGLFWGNRRRSRYHEIRGMMRGPYDR